MKLLITGGTGFLGRRAAEHFRGLGHTVLTPGRQELDITDREQVLAWLQTHRPQWVLHTAAVSDTQACQKDPAATGRVNRDAPGYLAEACSAVGARLVFCSSDQVYSGSPRPGPHLETEALSPSPEYARQKLEAEGRCLAAAPDAVCLRLSWMYSRDSLPGEHGHLLTTLRTALRRGDAMTFPIYDRRGITPVEAVVENLPLAFGLPGGVYNFGCENTASTYATLRSCLEQLHAWEALSRLTPNEAAFADAPRDISMDCGRIRANGIRFPDTATCLMAALKENL